MWSEFNKYIDHCHDLAQKAGWWTDLNTGKSIKENPLTFSNKLFLVVSECVEALEGDRTNAQDDKLPHRKMTEVELADAIIRIFDLAGAYGFDLGGAIEEKLAFNKTRLDHQPSERLKAEGKRY